MTATGVPDSRPSTTPLTSPEDANALKRTARTAGLLYLVMSALMIFGYMYAPAKFIVSEDAAATARKILEAQTLYRMTVLVSWIGQILFLFVVLNLYQLFRNVDRFKARLIVVLVSVAVSAEFVVIANRITPLNLLDGSRSLSTLGRPQLESMAYGSLVWGANLARLLMSFWGLWLLPFGLLVIQSRFIPKVFGYLLLAAGTGYIATFLAAIAFPEALPAVQRVASPLYFGEVPIIFWLMIAGVRMPRAGAAGERVHSADARPATGT